MPHSHLSSTEMLLANLIHDLRQPLGNIESGAWVLATLTKSGDPRVQEQVRAIERQVEHAEQVLSAAAGELARMAQRAETADSFEATKPAS
jgi:signal transduction histidine kinase